MKNQQPLPLEKPARVRLSPDDRERKGHELAVKGLAIRSYERELQSKTKDTRKAIKTLKAEISELQDQIVADEELKDQGQLFVGGAPTKEQAQAALATVAKVASEGRVPTEPHRFDPVGAVGQSRQICALCGSGVTDPVHVDVEPGEAASPAEHAHTASSGNGKHARVAKRGLPVRGRGRHPRSARP